MEQTEYGYSTEITTRVQDMDSYNFINVAAYLEYGDTAATDFMRDLGIPIDVDESTTFATLVVDTRLQLKRACRYPGKLQCGVRISRIGNSSMEAQIGIFKKGETKIVCLVSMVYVFADINTQKPIPIPNDIRRLLQESPKCVQGSRL